MLPPLHAPCDEQIAVTRYGAEPSLPSRAECLALMQGKPLPPREASSKSILSAASSTHSLRRERPPPRHGNFTEAVWQSSASGDCPLKFASRLNSMKDRPDLWDGTLDTLGMVARQGTIQGLGLVDFNYPQHLKGLSLEQVYTVKPGGGVPHFRFFRCLCIYSLFYPLSSGSK